MYNLKLHNDYVASFCLAMKTGQEKERERGGGGGGGGGGTDRERRDRECVRE